ncbi:MAG: ABC transporter permease [Verrucomicrobia bacterium]|nr:ABC transporter permease [Verrucomicrobiota bacterium]MBI3867677.1 ABC transporter permease [Verrucomicrobiota bacterium]
MTAPDPAFSPRASASPPASVTPSQRAWRRFWRNRPSVAGLAWLAFLVALMALWPWVAPYSFSATSDVQFSPPSATHWFGTDVNGRDLLTRVVYGARVSVMVALVGALVAVVNGVLWGASAGFFGGRWDGFAMRVVDILYSLPSIIFVIVLITTLESWTRQTLQARFHLGPEIVGKARLLFLFAGLGAISWLNMARIIRGQVLSLRSRAFVDASLALGATPGRVLFKHILPNVYGVIIVYATLTVPSIILYESFLSYLGLGIQPPMASWGSLISDGASQLNPIRVHWWLIVFPAGALVTTLLAMNFVGDGLRDAWDPKGRND